MLDGLLDWCLQYTNFCTILLLVKRHGFLIKRQEKASINGMATFQFTHETKESKIRSEHMESDGDLCFEIETVSFWLILCHKDR